MTTKYPVDSTVCADCDGIGGHAVGCTTVRTTVEEMTLDVGERTYHYERDYDLFLTSKPLQRGGEYAAFLFLELGIDGYDTHRARLDFGTITHDEDEAVFKYGRDEEVRALTDAIETLTAMRDRLVKIEAL